MAQGAQLKRTAATAAVTTGAAVAAVAADPAMPALTAFAIAAIRTHTIGVGAFTTATAATATVATGSAATATTTGTAIAANQRQGIGGRIMRSPAPPDAGHAVLAVIARRTVPAAFGIGDVLIRPIGSEEISVIVDNATGSAAPASGHGLGAQAALPPGAGLGLLAGGAIDQGPVRAGGTARARRADGAAGPRRAVVAFGYHGRRSENRLALRGVAVPAEAAPSPVIFIGRLGVVYVVGGNGVELLRSDAALTAFAARAAKGTTGAGGAATGRNIDDGTRRDIGIPARDEGDGPKARAAHHIIRVERQVALEAEFPHPLRIDGRDKRRTVDLIDELSVAYDNPLIRKDVVNSAKGWSSARGKSEHDARSHQAAAEKGMPGHYTPRHECI